MATGRARPVAFGLLAGMGVGAAAPAFAQGAPVGEVQAVDVAAVPAPPPARHDDDKPEVSDADKPKASSMALTRMRGILARVLKYLEEAREERDVVKLNCVNEKLTAVKGLLKISEQADVTLQESLSKRNSQIAGHEFEKIQIALHKCEVLLSESEACVGELAVYSGDTEVELVVEGVPPEDPTVNLPETEIITRPPAASPFQ